MQTFFELPLWSGTVSEVVAYLKQALHTSPTPCLVFTPNPEQVMYAKDHPEFLDTLQRASLLLPDGRGLVWAWKQLGLGHIQRVSGIDVVAALLASQEGRQQRSLIIGGRGYGEKTICGQTVHTWTANTPETPTAGLYWIPGFSQVSTPTTEERVQVAQCLRSLQPQLVFVAFGAPAQERFIAEYFDLFCQTQTRVVMAVGGSFDVLSGKLRRAPVWMQNAGLEWLFRLLQQPWRFSRQLQLLRFIWIVLATPRQRH